MQTLPFCPLQTLRFTIRARQTLKLTHFPGSALRSVFGDPLKRNTCLMMEKIVCKACPVRKACVYAYLFDSSLENERAKGTADSYPRPYIINPSRVQPGGIPKGEDYQFDIVLIGNAVNYARFVVEAIQAGGLEDGLGSNRGKFDLKSVDSITSTGEQRVYPGSLTYVPDDRVHSGLVADCSEIAISFVTPLRLMVNGRLFNKPPSVQLNTKPIFETPSFQLIIKRILDRAVNLWEGYCSDVLFALPDDLLEKAAQIYPIDSYIDWEDLDRYSSFQGDFMKTGGMYGGATYQGEISPFLPLLRLGERINFGKLTTMGLGKIHLECR